ncbi:putative NADP(+)-dependent dehydrogenase [Polyplosphaeria fusca]|uniref:NADP(+)-dependent dehydrogenase n=1 Tax=Polyplosphaeria fusca TaxID=682080 RepID=A0A9P4V179_9PLEO|nr:putative NADP(+)-dependent dehydrogenase [Polyplosphaeria fusca]
MSFPYKHVLLIGATSGIGLAMADRLIKEGVKVTAVGRRKDRLDEFVQKHGTGQASQIIFDVCDLDKISEFASSAIEAHPTIDCIFLNAGIQRRYDFSKPETVDLARFNTEITTNFTSFVALTHAFLSYLLNAKETRGLIYTGTHISVVPAFAMPAYSASKAALDSFVMCLREQLRDTNTKVVNVSPPLVQSEIHDAEMGPAGRKMGMPVEAFTDAAYAGIAAGTDNVLVGSIGGSSEEQFVDIVDRREAAFDRLSELIRKFA